MASSNYKLQSDTRNANLNKVLDALPGTRAEILEHTKLSRSTIGECIRYLIANKEMHISERIILNERRSVVYAVGRLTSRVKVDKPLSVSERSKRYGLKRKSRLQSEPLNALFGIK